MKAVYVISVAASLAGMHPQTLRIYERRGLIDPYRTPGGTRRYSEQDIERLGLIQDLTDQGVNLEGVKRIMELEMEVERLRAEVKRLRGKVAMTTREAEEQIRAVHRSYRRDIVVRGRALPDVRRDPLGG
ncbi:MAG: MerR family transcriptional regulator [Acidimicrobiia bacterium]|nr:MerR family transcriptional regulator [Acidimicrobiia bacterium]